MVNPVSSAPIQPQEQKLSDRKQQIDRLFAEFPGFFKKYEDSLAHSNGNSATSSQRSFHQLAGMEDELWTNLTSAQNQHLDGLIPGFSEILKKHGDSLSNFITKGESAASNQKSFHQITQMGDDLVHLWASSVPEKDQGCPFGLTTLTDNQKIKKLSLFAKNFNKLFNIEIAESKRKYFEIYLRERNLRAALVLILGKRYAENDIEEFLKSGNISDLKETIAFSNQQKKNEYTSALRVLIACKDCFPESFETMQVIPLLDTAEKKEAFTTLLNLRNKGQTALYSYQRELLDYALQNIQDGYCLENVPPKLFFELLEIPISTLDNDKEINCLPIRGEKIPSFIDLCQKTGATLKSLGEIQITLDNYIYPTQPIDLTPPFEIRTKGIYNNAICFIEQCGEMVRACKNKLEKYKARNGLHFKYGKRPTDVIAAEDFTKGNIEKISQLSTKLDDLLKIAKLELKQWDEYPALTSYNLEEIFQNLTTSALDPLIQALNYCTVTTLMCTNQFPSHAQQVLSTFGKEFNLRFHISKLKRLLKVADSILCRIESPHAPEAIYEEKMRKLAVKAVPEMEQREMKALKTKKAKKKIVPIKKKEIEITSHTSSSPTPTIPTSDLRLQRLEAIQNDIRNGQFAGSFTRYAFTIQEGMPARYLKKEGAATYLQESGRHLLLSAQDFELFSYALLEGNIPFAYVALRNLLLDLSIALEQDFSSTLEEAEKPVILNHRLSQLANAAGKQLPPALQCLDRAHLALRYPEDYRDENTQVLQWLDALRQLTPETVESFKKEILPGIFDCFSTAWGQLTNSQNDIGIDVIKEAIQEKIQCIKKMESFPIPKPKNLGTHSPNITNAALKEGQYYQEIVTIGNQMHQEYAGAALSFWHLRNTMEMEKAIRAILKAVTVSQNCHSQMGHHYNNFLPLLEEKEIYLIHSEEKMKLDECYLGISHHYLYLLDPTDPYLDAFNTSRNTLNDFATSSQSPLPPTQAPNIQILETVLKRISS